MKLLWSFIIQLHKRWINADSCICYDSCHCWWLKIFTVTGALCLFRVDIANQKDYTKMSKSLIKRKLLHGHNHFSLGSEIWRQINKAKMLLPKFFICFFVMNKSVQFIKIMTLIFIFQWKLITTKAIVK